MGRWMMQLEMHEKLLEIQRRVFPLCISKAFSKMEGV